MKDPFLKTIEEKVARIGELQKLYAEAKDEKEQMFPIFSNPPPAYRMMEYSAEIEKLQEEVKDKMGARARELNNMIKEYNRQEALNAKEDKKTL